MTTNKTKYFQALTTSLLTLSLTLLVACSNDKQEELFEAAKETNNNNQKVDKEPSEAMKFASLPEHSYLALEPLRMAVHFYKLSENLKKGQNSKCYKVTSQTVDLANQSIEYKLTINNCRMNKGGVTPGEFQLISKYDSLENENPELIELKLETLFDLKSEKEVRNKHKYNLNDNYNISLNMINNSTYRFTSKLITRSESVDQRGATTKTQRGQLSSESTGRLSFVDNYFFASRIRTNFETQLNDDNLNKSTQSTLDLRTQNNSPLLLSNCLLPTGNLKMKQSFVFGTNKSMNSDQILELENANLKIGGLSNSYKIRNCKKDLHKMLESRTQALYKIQRTVFKAN